MKHKCENCNNTYHPKDDCCIRCDFREAVDELVEDLLETKVGKFMIRIVDWVNEKLEK